MIGVYQGACAAAFSFVVSTLLVRWGVNLQIVRLTGVQVVLATQSKWLLVVLTNRFGAYKCNGKAITAYHNTCDGGVHRAALCTLNKLCLHSKHNQACKWNCLVDAARS